MSQEIYRNVRETLEARAGIEPTYKDLQSSASPLCHRAKGLGYLSFPRSARKPESVKTSDHTSLILDRFTQLISTFPVLSNRYEKQLPRRKERICTPQGRLLYTAHAEAMDVAPDPR